MPILAAFGLPFLRLRLIPLPDLLRRDVRLGSVEDDSFELELASGLVRAVCLVLDEAGGSKLRRNPLTEICLVDALPPGDDSLILTIIEPGVIDEDAVDEGDVLQEDVLCEGST